MLDRPDLSELMEALSAFLSEEVVPAFDGSRRFHALVAANVARIVAREVRDGERLAALEMSELAALLGHTGEVAVRSDTGSAAGSSRLHALSAELCEKIERGDFDGDSQRAALIGFLKRSVNRRLEIDNPKLAG
jgi:hypothetical protein